MRSIVAIQSRREVSLQKGPAVFCNAVIKDQQGQVEFGCYDTKIQPHLTLGSNVDVEWTEKPGKEYQGKPTTQRTITQLYIDGQPLVEAKHDGGGKGNWRGDYKKDTPSIEGQTAAKIVSELWIGDKIKETDILVTELKTWCGAKLKASIKAASAEQEPSCKVDPTNVRNQSNAVLSAEFMAACKEAGYDLAKQEDIDSVKAWLHKNFKTTLSFKELAEAKQREAIAAMKKEKLPFS